MCRISPVRRLAASVPRAGRRWGFWACLQLLLGGEVGADSSHYARCAACHLATGAGVPDLFPPLAGHVERFFASSEGRGYLSRLVTGGASGAIEVDGVLYAGLMPPVVADLSHDEVADLLNDLVRRFGSMSAPLFTPADVAAARAAGSLSGDERASLRRRVLTGTGGP